MNKSLNAPKNFSVFVSFQVCFHTDALKCYSLSLLISISSVMFVKQVQGSVVILAGTPQVLVT